jgi:raffinose/stachyose/melibiose transport system permease protein
MVNHLKNTRVIVLFLLPVGIVYFLFMVLPILGTLGFSFLNWNGVQGAKLDFVGLGNYLAMFESPEFAQSVLNIIWFVALSIFLQIPIGYALAFLINETTKLTRFFKAVFFVPMVLPMTATAILWRFILFPNDSGMLNSLLVALGLPGVQWLVESSTALNCLIIVTAWSSFGYYMIIGLAALTGVPNEVLEAAIIDGAGRFTRVFKIILPMIRESIVLSITLVMSGVFRIFDVVYVMTDGGPAGLTNVPATLMYKESFMFNHFGMGSAISVVIFFMSLSAVILNNAILRRESLAI